MNLNLEPLYRVFIKNINKKCKNYVNYSMNFVNFFIGFYDNLAKEEKTSEKLEFKRLYCVKAQRSQ